MTDLSNVNPESRAETLMASPDKIAKVRELFGVDSDMEVPAFSEADERVPDLDPTYVFDPNTTLAICAGFAKNRRVMVQGYHGTGKSTHIEQVAARLKWSFIRINLDAHISRIDLVGRDAIVLRERQQAVSRHAADQPGPDGPLEHRRHAQLPARAGRGADRPRQVGRVRPCRRQ